MVTGGKNQPRWIAVQAMQEAETTYPTELVLRYVTVFLGMVVAILLTHDILIFLLLTTYFAASTTFHYFIRQTQAPVSRRCYLNIFISNAVATASYALCAVYLVSYGTIELITMGLAATIVHGFYNMVRHRVVSALTIWDTAIVVISWMYLSSTVMLQLDTFLGKAVVLVSTTGVAFYYLNSQFQIIHTNTQLKRARENAIETQKMRAVGQLTAGIAHDFNNLLTVVRGNIELMEICPPGQPTAVYMNEAKAAVDRATQLTARLLTFSSKARLLAQPVPLSSFLPTFKSLAERICPLEVDVSVSYAAGITELYCDPNQLESVLLNLTLNAQDAIGKSGVITFTCKHTSERLLSQLGLKDDKLRAYATIQVHDTGPGFSAEILNRVTEPFFTTKSVGEGSGLGLSIAKGFAEQSGGGLVVSNAPSGGAIVSLVLPTRAMPEKVKKPVKQT
ncbi:MAG: ATP-binding protein [Litoreibacter sp.]